MESFKGFILCQNYRVYAYYIHHYKINKREWVYLQNLRQLAGMPSDTIILMGLNAWACEDFENIYHYIEDHDMNARQAVENYFEGN